MSSYQRDGKQRFKPSFLRRQGKMTKAQKRYFREYWSNFGLNLEYNTRFSAQEYFGNQNPVSLEIGFGQAETLLYRAIREPNRNFIGIEVHKPAIAACLGKLSELNIDNVLLLKKDAYLVFLDHLRDSIIDEVLVFFPKPWADEERRILRLYFLEILEKHLRPEARLYCATDVSEYAEYAMQQFEMNPRWLNTSGIGQFSSRPSWRQISKYEEKGFQEGRLSVDFCFCYRG